ncbi:MAG: DUF4388 domain-containing protein [Rhodoferax sp.]|nr:DUF4388 domain-containing protein [Rhodoferax sp.]
MATDFKDSSFFPLQTALMEIELLCEKARSGVAYLISDDNRLAQVHLRKGAVVTAIFRNKRGKDALEHIRSIRSCSFRFDEKVAPSASVDLSSEAFFSYFAFNSTVGASASTSDVSWDQKTSQLGLSAEVRLALETTLKKYIGPIASIVCEECFDQLNDAASVIDALAKEVPTQAEAVKFRAEAAKAVRGG